MSQIPDGLEAWSQPVTSRAAALDGLRGFAILTMLAQHAQAIPPLMGSTYCPRPLDALLLQAMNGFWIFLDIFFVLSGFFTVSTLLSTRRSPNPMRKFWIRRILRLVPLYYLVLALYLYVFTFSDVPQSGHAENFANQWWFWSFLSNIYLVTINGFAGPLSSYWFLALEVQVLLLLCCVLAWVPPKHFARVLLALIAFSLASRCILWVAGVPNLTIYRLTTSRLDGYCLGGLTAIGMGLPGLRPSLVTLSRKAFPVCCAALCLVVLTTGAFSSAAAGKVVDSWDSALPITLGFTLCGLTWSTLLVLLLDGGRLAALFDRHGFRVCGKYSYGMFMSNLFVMGIFMIAGVTRDSFMERFENYLWVGIAAYTALMLSVSFVVGAITWHGFERFFPPLARFTSRRRQTSYLVRTGGKGG